MKRLDERWKRGFKLTITLVVLIVTLAICRQRPNPDLQSKQIAFVSSRGGEEAICLMDADGANQLRVSDPNPGGSCCPAWSPDGTRLAYAVNAIVSCSGSYLSSVKMLDLETSTTTIIKDCGECYCGRAPHRLWWSQGSDCLSWLSYSLTGPYRQNIAIVGNQQDSLRCTGEIPGDAIPYTYKNCSPNDEYCLRSLYNREKRETEGFLLSTSGITIPLGTGFFSSAAWSPDFTQVAFTLYDSQTTSPLYVIRTTDAEPRQLTIELNISERSNLAWSPDSRWIAFSAAVPASKNIDIYKVNVETGEIHRLTTHPAEDTESTWRPAP